MTNRDKQYHIFFERMGYEFVYYPEKSGFMIKGVGYAKVCDYPANEFLHKVAKENSYKQTTILLEGDLTFKPYTFYRDGSATDSIFIPKGEKYYPIFWQNEYDVSIFPGTSKNIAIVINGGDITCTRCGSVNDIEIEKPSIHYKAVCQCGHFVKNIGSNAPAILYFGKYKGREIASMKSNEELQYLQWCLGSDTIKGKIRSSIEKHLAL